MTEFFADVLIDVGFGAAIVLETFVIWFCRLWVRNLARSPSKAEIYVSPLTFVDLFLRSSVLKLN
jgi:hypothetical protein